MLDLVLRFIVIALENVLFTYAMITLANLKIKNNINLFIGILAIGTISFCLFVEFTIIILFISYICLLIKQINIKIIISSFIAFLIIMILSETLLAIIFKETILHEPYFKTFALSIFIKIIEFLILKFIQKENKNGRNIMDLWKKRRKINN